MWEKLYKASMENPFRKPFISAECAGDDKKGAPAKKPSTTKGKDAPKYSCEFGTPEYFMYCSIGGALSCGITHCLVTPLDVIKCRIQVNPDKYKGVVSGFKTTVAEEGVKGLVRGWFPTLLGYSMQGACKFGLYEYFKIAYSKMLSPEDAYNYRTFVYLAASASAEFFADIALSPMEAVKVKIQTTEDCGRRFLECAPKMLSEEGLGAFYKSLVPLWMRQIPYTMMKFACFERTIELLYQHVVPKPREQCTYQEQLVVTFAAGYIAGVFCAIVSHPADTLVSKMNQQQGCTAAQMIKMLGFKGLWGGLGTRIIMVGTLTGLQWFIYDGVKVWLGIPRPPPPEVPKSTGKKPPPKNPPPKKK
ncbi:hypothetical protein RUM44_006866 [Polyplax serrata]|uniref:Uncharacterized protein n=1 Tax=Polyplax serrata TaxID=468196 RepID=A0ABR1AJ98_POLSC